MSLVQQGRAQYQGLSSTPTRKTYVYCSTISIDTITTTTKIFHEGKAQATTGSQTTR